MAVDRAVLDQRQEAVQSHHLNFPDVHHFGWVAVCNTLLLCFHRSFFLHHSRAAHHHHVPTTVKSLGQISWCPTDTRTVSIVTRTLHTAWPRPPPLLAPRTPAWLQGPRVGGAQRTPPCACPHPSHGSAPTTDAGAVPRPSSAAANKPRKRAPAATSSGYKGVSWIDNSKKWRAQVGHLVMISL